MREREEKENYISFLAHPKEKHSTILFNHDPGRVSKRGGKGKGERGKKGGLAFTFLVPAQLATKGRRRRKRKGKKKRKIISLQSILSRSRRAYGGSRTGGREKGGREEIFLPQRLSEKKGGGERKGRVKVTLTLFYRGRKKRKGRGVIANARSSHGTSGMRKGKKKKQWFGDCLGSRSNASRIVSARSRGGEGGRGKGKRERGGGRPSFCLPGALARRIAERRGKEGGEEQLPDHFLCLLIYFILRGID